MNFNPVFQSVTQHISWESESQGASTPVPSCLLLPIAHLGAQSVPIPAMCSAEYPAGASFCCCSVVLSHAGCQTYSRLLHLMENPGCLVPQRWAELTFPLTSARKCFPFLIIKVYFSLWPWVIRSLAGCHRNRSAPSPRSVQFLNVRIADTGTFSRLKGHRLWRAARSRPQPRTL